MPTVSPCSPSRAVTMRATEPLPLVPVTWIDRIARRWGSPSTLARARRMWSSYRPSMRPAVASRLMCWSRYASASARFIGRDASGRARRSGRGAARAGLRGGAVRGTRVGFTFSSTTVAVDDDLLDVGRGWAGRT